MVSISAKPLKFLKASEFAIYTQQQKAPYDDGWLYRLTVHIISEAHSLVG